MRQRQSRLRTLRERDGDICHICKLPMSFRKVDGGLAITASIDHLSVEDRTAQALAHRWCNSHRQNNPITPELIAACRAQIEPVLAKYWRYEKHLREYYDSSSRAAAAVGGANLLDKPAHVANDPE